MYIVTFYKDGKVTSTCYLNDSRSQKAIEVWKARGDGRSATKELSTK